MASGFRRRNTNEQNADRVRRLNSRRVQDARRTFDAEIGKLCTAAATSRHAGLEVLPAISHGLRFIRIGCLPNARGARSTPGFDAAPNTADTSPADARTIELPTIPDGRRVRQRLKPRNLCVVFLNESDERFDTGIQNWHRMLQ